jgi:hypothetical protein
MDIIHFESTDRFLTYLMLVWVVLNLLWAQVPRPEDERLEKIWRLIHHVFGLIVTHATTKGTFTWPFFLFYLAKNLNLPTKNPFEDEKESKNG